MKLWEILLRYRTLNADKQFKATKKSICSLHTKCEISIYIKTNGIKIQWGFSFPGELKLRMILKINILSAVFFVLLYYILIYCFMYKEYFSVCAVYVFSMYPNYLRSTNYKRVKNALIQQKSGSHMDVEFILLDKNKIFFKIFAIVNLRTKRNYCGYIKLLYMFRKFSWFYTRLTESTKAAVRLMNVNWCWSSDDTY